MWTECIREWLPLQKHLPVLQCSWSPRALGMQPIINSHASGILVWGGCQYHKHKFWFAVLREVSILTTGFACCADVQQYIQQGFYLISFPYFLHSEFPSLQQLTATRLFAMYMIHSPGFTVLLPCSLRSLTCNWAFHYDQLQEGSLCLTV